MLTDPDPFGSPEPPDEDGIATLLDQALSATPFKVFDDAFGGLSEEDLSASKLVIPGRAKREPGTQNRHRSG